MSLKIHDKVNFQNQCVSDGVNTFKKDERSVLYDSIKLEKFEENRSRKRILKKFGRTPRDYDVAFVCRPSLLYPVWDIPEIETIKNTKNILVILLKNH